jgi:hypothetical protein
MWTSFGYDMNEFLGKPEKVEVEPCNSKNAMQMIHAILKILCK